MLTDEAITFVPSSCRLSGQHAGLNLSEGLKDALNVVIGEVGVDRCHVDPVKGTSFLRELVNDWLSLADVTGPPNLQDEQQGKIPKPKDGLYWFKPVCTGGVCTGQ